MTSRFRTFASGPLRPRRLGSSRIRMPSPRRAAIEQIGRRLLLAVGLIVFIALVVTIQRNGYTDSVDGSVSVLDAFYFATVSVTTTGFGDIAPVSEAARLVDVVLLTPTRVLFLIVLVGSTIEVLTDQSRHALAAQQWRRRVKDHTIICGFGSTGRSAARALEAQGTTADGIVVIEPDPDVARRANSRGYVVIDGNASETTVLEAAHIERARAVIVTPNRDDTAVLITLTAREMNPDVTIVAAGREAENLHLLRQSGADSVIHSAEAVGRLMGLATRSAAVAGVMDDLLMPGDGMKVFECDPVPANGDGYGVPAGTSLLAIVRDGVTVPMTDDSSVEVGDRLVVLKASPDEPG